jgi:hypothetical protein
MTEVSLTPVTPARRLAAVLFADIVGFTRLTAQDDAAAFQLASTLQECSRRSITREGGRVVRFVGDSVLAEFPSAESAVLGAFSLTREFEGESAAQNGSPAKLHIGVHVGELTEASSIPCVPMRASQRYWRQRWKVASGRLPLFLRRVDRRSSRWAVRDRCGLPRCCTISRFRHYGEVFSLSRRTGNPDGGADRILKRGRAIGACRFGRDDAPRTNEPCLELVG